MDELKDNLLQLFNNDAAFLARAKAVSLNVQCVLEEDFRFLYVNM